MKYDVFISYSSKDQKVAEDICGYMEEHGIRCFAAYRDIPKGKVWATAIVDGLEESRMMVVVFSNNFNMSDQVDREIELASEDKKPILTYRITEDTFKGAKKYYLKNINWIDAYPDPKANLGMLLSNVHRLLESDEGAADAGADTPNGINDGQRVSFADNTETSKVKEPASQSVFHSFIKSFLKKRWLFLNLAILVIIVIVTVFLVTGRMPFMGQDSTASQVEVEKTHESPNQITFSAGGVSFDMIRVEGGTFTMGATSEQEDDAYDDEAPVHKVTLGSYYIGQTEVTQALWEAVMGNNPSNFKGKNLPVENVSWDDCQEFISRLNSVNDYRFRLPTEAEWEFAAKGGSRSGGFIYSGSGNADEVAWDDANSESRTHPVKTKKANEIGLYDMSGNVWEWCYDWYGHYSASPQTDPKGAETGDDHVSRGGGWDGNDVRCRNTNRGASSPGKRVYYLGLRLVLSE